MGFTWMAAGVFGLLGTSFYEIIVKSYGLVSAGVAGALMHLVFVVGTIGGLFIKGTLLVENQPKFLSKFNPLWTKIVGFLVDRRGTVLHGKTF